MKKYNEELLKSDESLLHTDTYMSSAKEHMQEMSEGLAKSVGSAAGLAESFKVIAASAAKLDLDKANKELKEIVGPLEQSTAVSLRLIHGGQYDEEEQTL